MEDGAPPAQAVCADLIDSLCARGLAAEAYAALSRMQDAGRALSIRMCCQTMTACLRANMLNKAFAVFEAHLEFAGRVDSTLSSLASRTRLCLASLYLPCTFPVPSLYLPCTGE